MTRDEAIKILWNPSGPMVNWAVSMSDAEGIVDRLAALGILKLDEPKTAVDHAVEALFGLPVHDTLVDRETAKHIVHVLYGHGLRIVRAKP